MKLKSLKTLKSVVTKKEKTGTTKVKKSPTQSKPTTSRTLYAEVSVSNLKDIFHSVTGENCHVSFDPTPESTCEFYFRETTPSGKEVRHIIRIGREGLAYSTQWDQPFQRVGWKKLVEALNVYGKPASKPRKKNANYDAFDYYSE